jgi:hypothetical protein
MFGKHKMGGFVRDDAWLQVDCEKGAVTNKDKDQHQQYQVWAIRLPK